MEPAVASGNATMRQASSRIPRPDSAMAMGVKISGQFDVRVLACDGLADAGGSMIRSDLVRHVASKNPHLHVKDAQRIVDAVLDEIGAALARRDRVEARGFGVFTVRLQSARPGHNPKNGAAISVPAKFYPYFRPSKGMHSRLNRETGS